MGTTENLKEAFAGESQAHQRYLAFSEKAEAEGYPQVAKLFRAAAQAERVHAQAHLRVLGAAKATAQNVQAAIEGEAAEFKHMYPGFLAEAEATGSTDAAVSFGNAMAVERIHHNLYTEALKAVEAGKDSAAAAISVCGVCGNTVVGDAPNQCPICSSPKSKFSATV